MKLLYDNTMNGLLTAIFEVYRLKLDTFEIIPAVRYREQLLQPVLRVATNVNKANRIKIGMLRKTGADYLPHLADLFCQNHREQQIYQFIQKMFAVSENQVATR